MENELNFKVVLLRLFNNNKPQKQMILTPQRFFGMQPYFNPTKNKERTLALTLMLKLSNQLKHKQHAANPPKTNP